MERNDNEAIEFRARSDSLWATQRFVEYMVKVVKDFTRALDYLQTRSDIDASKIGYFGASEGGIWAPLLLAASSDRVRASVLKLGGFQDARIDPQVDPLNYVTRVTAPTLMLNGRYDTNLTLHEEVNPMFQRLGTPAEDKRLQLFESDHFVPLSDLVREALAWFDKYLGDVG